MAEMKGHSWYIQSFDFKEMKSFVGKVDLQTLQRWGHYKFLVNNNIDAYKT